MDFDLYELDRIPGWDEGADVLEEYIDGLTERFAAAPEGQGLPEPGYWAGQAIRCAYVDLRLTLPHVAAKDVRAILTEVLPAKLGVHAPYPERAIPELSAFWAYLRRAFGLKQAPAIQRTLEELEPTFPELMAQGTARSLQELAAEATPTEEQQAQALVEAYGQSQALPETIVTAMRATAPVPDMAALFGSRPGEATTPAAEIDLSELEPDRSHKKSVGTAPSRRRSAGGVMPEAGLPVDEFDLSELEPDHSHKRPAASSRGRGTPSRAGSATGPVTPQDDSDFWELEPDTSHKKQGKKGGRRG